MERALRDIEMMIEGFFMLRFLWVVFEGVYISSLFIFVFVSLLFI